MPLDIGNLLGLPERPAYGGYQFDIPQAAAQPVPQAMPQAMPQAAPMGRPRGLRGILDSIGDALLVANGAEPIHRQRRIEAQQQQALQGFLTNPDQAIAALMQVPGGAADAITLYRAVHPPSETPTNIKEYDYAKKEGYGGSYEDFVKLTHPALLSPVTLGANDTIEQGGGDSSGGEVTATNPTTGEKVRYNSQTGAWEPMGGQTASPSGGFPLSAANNPGALRVPGSKQFQRFGSPQEGIQAQEALLRRRYFGRGLNTVASIVETYAPRRSKGGDNSDASVNNYISHVASRLGVDPSAPLSLAALPRLAAAMREFETGQRAN